MCVIISAMAIGPRIVGVLWWLLDSARWNAAFNGALLPILGLLVLPWTTLAYVLVSNGGSVSGWGLLVIAIAVIVDVSTYGSGAYKNKDKVGFNY